MDTTQRENTAMQGTRSQRWREGVPVVDAVADVVIYVTPGDIEGAVPGDPCNCAIARAVRRIVGSADADAQILRSKAYVKAYDDQGNPVWHRFVVADGTRLMIERFDATGEAHRGGYRLIAPRGSQTLDERLTRQRKRDQQRKRRTSGEKRYRVGEKISLEGTVRNGGGQVHCVFREEGSDA